MGEKEGGSISPGSRKRAEKVTFELVLPGTWLFWETGYSHGGHSTCVNGQGRACPGNEATLSPRERWLGLAVGWPQEG